MQASCRAAQVPSTTRYYDSSGGGDAFKSSRLTANARPAAAWLPHLRPMLRARIYRISIVLILITLLWSLHWNCVRFSGSVEVHAVNQKPATFMHSLCKKLLKVFLKTVCVGTHLFSIAKLIIQEPNWKKKQFSATRLIFLSVQAAQVPPHPSPGESQVRGPERG